MTRQQISSIVVALVLGYAQFSVLAFLWSFIVRYSPLLQWCLALGLNRVVIHAVVSLADLSVNVLLSLPAAWMLLKLRPPKLALYLALAILPMFFLTNAPLISDRNISSMVLLAWMSQLAALPIAAYSLRALLKPDSRACMSPDDLHVCTK